MSCKEQDHYRQTILSILKAYILLFYTGCFGLDEQDEDFSSLLCFYHEPDKEKIDRLISILKTYELLRENGAFEDHGNRIEDIPMLIAYLKSLLKTKGTGPRVKALVKPENLGRSFFKNALGAPLFGTWRPERPPQSKGIFLCQSYSEGGEIAEISLSRASGNEYMVYEDLGLRLKQRQAWLDSAVFLRDKGHEINLELSQRNGNVSVFEFSRSRIFMAEKAVKKKFDEELFDPREARFLYFFYDGPSLKRKAVGFLTTLWAAGFGIPRREGENLAVLFIQRLLQS